MALSGVFNQSLASAGTFLLSIALARHLDPAAFGAWGVGQAVSIITVSAFNALVITPLSVTRTESPAQRRTLTSERLSLVLLILSIIAVGTVVVTRVLWSKHGHLVLLTSALAAATTLREFLLRDAYSDGLHRHVMQANVLQFSALAVLLVTATAVTGLDLKTGLAIQVLSVSLAATRLYSASGLRPAPVTFTSVRKQISSVWHEGRSLLISHAAVNLRSQLHVILTPAATSLSMLAPLLAARVLVAPAALMLPGLSQALLPRLATAVREGPQAATRASSFLLKALIGSTALLSIAAVIVAFWGPDSLLGDEYKNLRMETTLWAALTVASAFRTGSELQLTARGQFSHQARFNSIAALVTISIGLILVGIIGPLGTLAAMTIGELTVSGLTRSRLKRLAS